MWISEMVGSRVAKRGEGKGKPFKYSKIWGRDWGHLARDLIPIVKQCDCSSEL